MTRRTPAQQAALPPRGWSLGRRFASPAARSALALMAANYLQAAIGFALHLALARRLGPAAYGFVSFSLLIGGIAGTIVSFGSDRTLVRDLVQAEDRHLVFTASILQRALLAVGLAAAVGLAFHQLVPVWDARSAALLVGILWGVLAGLMPTAWLDARYEMGTSAWIALGERLLFALLALAVLAAELAPAPVIGVLGCLAISRLAGFAAQWAQSIRSYRPAWRGCGPRLGSLARENVWVLSAAAASLLLTHANQLLLESRAGVAELAQYAIGFQIISLVTIAQSQLMRLFSPQISQLTRPCAPTEPLRRGVLRHCGWSAGVTLALALPLFGIAPQLYEWLYRGQYAAAVAPTRLLCVWVVLYGPAMIVSQYLVCLRMTRALLLLTLLSGGLGVLLGQWLVPAFHASGVALALLFSHGPAMAAQAILLLRKTRSPDHAEAEAAGEQAEPLARPSSLAA